MIRQLLGLLADLTLGPRCTVCRTRCASRFLAQHADANHPGEVPR